MQGIELEVVWDGSHQEENADLLCVERTVPHPPGRQNPRGKLFRLTGKRKAVLIALIQGRSFKAAAEATGASLWQVRYFARRYCPRQRCRICGRPTRARDCERHAHI